MKVLIYLRSILALIIFVPVTFVSSVLMISNVIFHSRRFAEGLIRIWARIAVKLWSVQVDVEGRENVPAGGCLFVFNHSSDFDIPVIYSVSPPRCFFGAKIELFSIPFFGRALRIAGMLPITRSDRSGVLKLYDESIKRVHKGDSFLLAGEGTRQPVPGVGDKFKSGPFIFAINGQFPIVPLVLHGVGELLPKGQILACTKSWHSRVTLRYLKPISTTGLTVDDRERLKTDTREIMAQAYQELEHSGHNAYAITR
jgi:1-acyl-sn-glycerol-3-phosphate acyltransferase